MNLLSVDLEAFIMPLQMENILSAPVLEIKKKKEIRKIINKLLPYSISLAWVSATVQQQGSLSC